MYSGEHCSTPQPISEPSARCLIRSKDEGLYKSRNLDWKPRGASKGSHSTLGVQRKGGGTGRVSIAGCP